MKLLQKKKEVTSKRARKANANTYEPTDKEEKKDDPGSNIGQPITGGNVLGENNSTSAPEPKLNADASTMISHPNNDINDQMDSDSSKQESGGNVLGENNIISSITIFKLNAYLQNKNTEHILYADTSPLNSHAENDESLSINEQMDSDTPEQDASDKNGRKPITCAKVLT